MSHTPQRWAPATRKSLGLLAVLAVLGGGCASPSQPLQGGTAAGPSAGTTPAAAPISSIGAATPGAPPAGAVAARPQSAVSTVDIAPRSVAGSAGTGATAVAAAGLTLPTQRIVYFDFDSFAIKDDFKPLLEGHARVLARDAGRRLVIEGHTDERGGREYNLALGQKRADAVVRSLVLLGVSERQLEAVSFGEERPASTGATEQAWAQNRRAELKDR